MFNRYLLKQILWAAHLTAITLSINVFHTATVSIILSKFTADLSLYDMRKFHFDTLQIEEGELS